MKQVLIEREAGDGDRLVWRVLLACKGIGESGR